VRARVALALAVALALPTLSPSAGAYVPQRKVEFPPEVVALAHRWVNESLALGANDTQRPWYPQAQGFMDNATAALAQGRVRTTMFDLETYTELVLTGELMDQAANLSSDAERKSFVLDRADAWNVQAHAAWGDYRAKLSALEKDIHALRTMELALYSADEALTADLQLDGHDQLASDFPKQPGFPRDYILGIVRTDHTSILDLQWADDLLDLAGSYEGLPPKLESANWTLIANASLADPGFGGNVPADLQPIEKVGAPVRAANESTMAIAINLAEQRASRAQTIEVIFGDATGRVSSVLTDAAHGMNSQLNNTTMETPRSFGLLGVFTADAIDRVVFTDEFVDRGEGQLSFVIGAWANLDYNLYAIQTLAAASPVQPPPAVAKKSPMPEDAALVALGAAAQLLAARRPR
jgi:hypothetical protein